MGAGPAGIASAIQLRHSGVDFFLVGDGACGGQLSNAFCIENYPGLQPMSGRTLAHRFQNHLDRLKITIIAQHIRKISYSRRKQCFHLLAQSNKNFSCRFLVLATGTQPRRLPGCEIAGKTFYESRLLHRIKNRSIIVIGSGEAALDSALSLARHNRVTLVSKKRTSVFVAAKLMERVVVNNNIAIVHGGIRDAALNGSQVQVFVAGKPYSGDYLLVSIGRTINTPVLEKGICTKRLFFCGAARTGRLGQTVMAVGDGISAAMEINRTSTSERKVNGSDSHL